MNKRFLILIGVVILLAVFLVMRATQEAASLVLLPSDLLQRKSEDLKRIRVGGRVAALPVEYKVEPEVELKFFIRDPGKDEAASEQTVPVVYNGIKPDMFAPGRDVIIDGEFKQGTLVAGKLLTQCPSKYEPPAPGGKGNYNG